MPANLIIIFIVPIKNGRWFARHLHELIIKSLTLLPLPILQIYILFAWRYCSCDPLKKEVYPLALRVAKSSPILLI